MTIPDRFVGICIAAYVFYENAELQVYSSFLFEKYFYIRNYAV